MPILMLLAWLLVACGGVDAPPEPTASIPATAVSEPTKQPQDQEAVPDESATLPGDAAEETTSTSAATEEEVDDIPSGLRALTIDPGQSEARFLVDEVLLGADKTVVGVTSQVTGTISVDPADPASTVLSAITIDARDLTTDSSRRNRSIQRQILRSAVDENRHITFVPTAIDGLPESVTIGEPFSFTVTGDLTVRGEAQSETFDLSVTPVSQDEISGLAKTIIRYEDYGISIPSVPAVASVEDEVRLELEFVAKVAE